VPGSVWARSATNEKPRIHSGTPSFTTEAACLKFPFGMLRLYAPQGAGSPARVNAAEFIASSHLKQPQRNGA